MQTTLQHRGETGYHAGQAAELCVARYYEQRGYTLAHLRWRGTAGEIDLVLREGDDLIFVEVKKSRSFAQAALRVTPRQQARIFAAAEEYLAHEPAGTLTNLRFDVALVNAHGAVEVIENAFGHG